MVFTDKINIVMHHSSQGMFKKNILSKSLNVEVFKSTIGILLIFFFLVVSSRFVEYFNQAAEGLIDPNIIFKVVFLRFPDFLHSGRTDSAMSALPNRFCDDPKNVHFTTVPARL